MISTGKHSYKREVFRVDLDGVNVDVGKLFETPSDPGHIYVVEKDCDDFPCKDCYFNKNCGPTKILPVCRGAWRPDGQNVIFKRFI